jgi:O-antigen/teichoic acid export membrane protein
MTDDEVASLEKRLDKALLADMPPERDPWFRIATLERRERRVWRRRVFLSVCVVVVVSLLSALLLATLVDASADLIDDWPIESTETILAALAIIATACLTLLTAWLRRKSHVRKLFSAWMVKFWV